MRRIFLTFLTIFLGISGYALGMDRGNKDVALQHQRFIDQEDEDMVVIKIHSGVDTPVTPPDSGEDATSEESGETATDTSGTEDSESDSDDAQKGGFEVFGAALSAFKTSKENLHARANSDSDDSPKLSPRTRAFSAPAKPDKGFFAAFSRSSSCEDGGFLRTVGQRFRRFHQRGQSSDTIINIDELKKQIYRREENLRNSLHLNEKPLVRSLLRESLEFKKNDYIEKLIQSDPKLQEMLKAAKKIKDLEQRKAIVELIKDRAIKKYNRMREKDFEELVEQHQRAKILHDDYQKRSEEEKRKAKKQKKRHTRCTILSVAGAALFGVLNTAGSWAPGLTESILKVVSADFGGGSNSTAI